ncbi:MAG: CoA-binding protein [Candidatus Bathyarchaeales archaeon]
MKKHGFHIIPVNPFVDEVLGEKSYISLLDIPAEIQKSIEVVDIFRPSKDVPPIVEQIIKLRQDTWETTCGLDTVGNSQ